MEQPAIVFAVTVAEVARLSPSFVRITFAGDSLQRFHPCGPLGPRDLRVKLLLAADGSGPAGMVPDLSRRDGYQQWRAIDEAERGVARTYTIRRIRGSDPVTHVEVDVVLHPGGPASTWAEQAHPGDLMLVVGPNRESQWYGGIEWRPPAEGARLLLTGDETAVPAIASILETLPSDYAGHVVVEVPSAADVLSLETKADLDVRLLARNGRPRGELLLAEVEQVSAQLTGSGPEPDDVDIDSQLLWEVPPSGESELYSWVAGEAGMVRAVRRLLVHNRGVDRRAVAFMGYWRDGRPEPS